MVFQFPAPGPITSPFGWRVVRGRPNFHNGFDQAWLQSDPEGSRLLYAPGDGLVDVGWNEEAGNYVGITTPHGRLRLCHLESISVRPGQEVNRGDFIGVMGNSGYAIGVHLHLELWVNGTRIDPQPYFTIPYGPSLSGLPETPFEEEIQIERDGQEMLLLMINDGLGRYGAKGEERWAVSGPGYWWETTRKAVADPLSVRLGNASAPNLTYEEWEAAKAASAR